MIHRLITTSGIKPTYEKDRNRDCTWCHPSPSSLPKATGIGLLGEFFVGGSRRSFLLAFALLSQTPSPNTQKGTETNMKKSSSSIS